MFDTWADLFDDVEIPLDDNAIARTITLISRLQAKLAVVVSRFDATELWDISGATSMTAWLKAHGMLGADAATLARTGRRTRSFPALTQAWLSAQLTHGQVRAILGCIADRHVAMFSDHEAAVIPLLIGLSVDDTHTAMLRWRERAEAEIKRRQPEDPNRSAHLSQSLDGRWYLDANFDAEGGAVIDTAIRVADGNDRNRLPGERRADAIVNIMRFFLDNQQIRSGPRHRPHVNIVINGDTLGTGHLEGEIAETRLPLDSPTLSRILCDCNMHRALLDSKSLLLDYGTSTQTIPSGLWNALVVRDRHCRWPNCDRPPTWCEGHHVKWFSNGGPTNINNLVLLCVRHHHKLHLPGWTAWIEDDGELVVEPRSGAWIRSHPRRQPCAA